MAVTALHVIETIDTRPELSGAMADLQKRRCDTEHRYLEEINAARAGGNRIANVVTPGRPYREILRIAGGPMKAARLHAHGQPLHLDEIPTPSPGPGQVLVAVHGAGFCHSDIHVVDGEIQGFSVPVYCLDAALPENSATDQGLTDRLYGGDQRYRLSRETVLGIGGVRMLRELGHGDIHIFQMNEGRLMVIVR